MKAARVIVVAIALLVSVSGAIAADLTVEIRDPAGRPVADAVVHARPASGTVPPPRAGLRATIDQVNKEFVPRVSIVQAGTQVFFPNSDNIRHSIYSFSPAKTFTTKLYSGREAAPVQFDQTGLVVLGCNIHDTMVAWLYIVDTPWFASSGADGQGTVHSLPIGDWLLSVAAPSAGFKPAEFPMRIESDAPVRRTITLEAGS